MILGISQNIAEANLSTHDNNQLSDTPTASTGQPQKETARQKKYRKQDRNKSSND
jgi:hypothetical protein